jgi:membrane protease YdiL (CAAX protease family)
MPWIAAALVQAFLFGLIHAGYGTWTHVMGPFLFGLGMAFVARQLGIVVAALLHAQANIVFFTVEVAPTYLAVHGILGLAMLLAVTGALVAACLWSLYATRGDAIRILVRGLRRGPGAAAGTGPAALRDD